MAFYTAAALKNELQQRGFRLTPQREKILRVFQTLPQGKHLSAEELRYWLDREGEKVSLSTIYRTVKLMAQLGILRELEFAEGHKHYELNKPSEHHHHLVCVQCHQTIEFKNEAIAELCSAQAEARQFELLDCQLTLHCVCLEAVQEGWPYLLPDNWVCPKAHRPLG
ncbi:transcriptional repressor [Phormidium sp. CCY1219]|uniref:transcriptional repressor n=1 Tax=Phormidium sp. CCY1219 TaxID=2886104 RepID=UPI002D1E570E|nr:transcriptional repressor [Phormidium sp. CCY1219]MEB3831351.1 transcriptional repressor [Phormidium sp. CCY1219]